MDELLNVLSENYQVGQHVTVTVQRGLQVLRLKMTLTADAR